MVMSARLPAFALDLSAPLGETTTLAGGNCLWRWYSAGHSTGVPVVANGALSPGVPPCAGGKSGPAFYPPLATALHSPGFSAAPGCVDPGDCPTHDLGNCR